MPDFVMVLGRQPELSAAEIAALAGGKRWAVAPVNDLALRIVGGASPTDAFAQLGGTVKVAEVIGEVAGLRELEEQKRLAFLHRFFPPRGKMVFGVSVYGRPPLAAWSQRIGKALKVFLADNGKPARFLVGERGVLSSVVVDKERLVTKGMELLVFETPRGFLLARTVAVQAYEDFSQRDWGRPRRNARSGMLPPKLARIMVNLSGGDSRSRFLDPFCGSGTILQEALLLGYEDLVGSDHSERAVREAKENVRWVARREKRSANCIRFVASDVRQLAKELPAQSIDVIVTEPYLGPPLRGGENLNAIRSELGALYEESFRVFARLLRPGGRLVIALPVFLQNEKPHFLMNIDAFLACGFKLVPPLPPELSVFRKNLSFRETLVYYRPGQRVGREIVLLERKETQLR